MQNGNKAGGGDVILGGGQPGIHKPKGLLDALAEIQQFYIVERDGESIPEDFLTSRGKLQFFSVGLKTGLVSGLVSILLTPISIGVFDEYIPIFGNDNPGVFDKLFALLVCISFSLGYAIFLTTIRKYYIGEITKAAIKNLLRGVTIGAGAKMVIALIFYHFIYLVVLEPKLLETMLLKLYPFVKYDSLNELYGWLLDFKPVLLTSAYFTVFISILYVTIPWISIFIASRKTRNMMKQEKKILGITD